MDDLQFLNAVIPIVGRNFWRDYKHDREREREREKVIEENTNKWTYARDDILKL
jgi:hypothetical protein